jgi:hypothetical protein
MERVDGKHPITTSGAPASTWSQSYSRNPGSARRDSARCELENWPGSRLSARRRVRTRFVSHRV